MKLNYKRTILIGLGFFTVSLVWGIYNLKVPLFLDKLGLAGFTIGIIMALDNIFAVILQPVFGALSDRTNTPYGRRMPYLLIGIPLAAIAFFIVPFVSAGIIGLMITVILLNFFMSIYRSPAVALMPDLTPRSLRSEANGVINFMGGIGAVFSFVMAGVLLNIKEYYPFAAGSLIMIVTIIVMYNTIREPAEIKDKAPDENDNEANANDSEISNIENDKKSRTLSLVFILLAIFFWFAGYNAIETFFSTYGEKVLGIDESKTAFLLAVLSGTFVLFAIPAGFIAGRIGRKRTIMIGLVVLLVTLASLIFIRNITIMFGIMALGGISWALININSYPMVVEMTHNSNVGKFTGYYYFFSMLASIISPVLFGFIKDLLGDDFLFIYSSLAVLIAFFFMMLVKHGEAKRETSSAFGNIEHME